MKIQGSTYCYETWYFVSKNFLTVLREKIVLVIEKNILNSRLKPENLQNSERSQQLYLINWNLNWYKKLGFRNMQQELEK